MSETQLYFIQSNIIYYIRKPAQVPQTTYLLSLFYPWSCSQRQASVFGQRIQLIIICHAKQKHKQRIWWDEVWKDTQEYRTQNVIMRRKYKTSVRYKNFKAMFTLSESDIAWKWVKCVWWQQSPILVIISVLFSPLYNFFSKIKSGLP